MFDVWSEKLNFKEFQDLLNSENFAHELSANLSTKKGNTGSADDFKKLMMNSGKMGQL